MTEQQLAEAEVLAEVAGRPFIEYNPEIQSTTQVMSLVQAARFVPALVAEVRRLQGLVKQAEWKGGDGYAYVVICPWCSARAVDEKHKPTCPAFGESR